MTGGTEQVQVNLDDIKPALQHDPESFISFMIPNELSKVVNGEVVDSPIPEFHPRIFRRMTDTTIDRFVCAVPRDHAKTTLAKLAAVWYFLFTHKRFIVYVSNTADIAINGCKDIANLLLSPNLEAVFGKIEPLEWQDGKGRYRFKIGNKVCILRAQGAGQQIRGLNVDHQRPDLAIVDDLEDMDNTATPALQEKLIRWFYGSFYKALDKFDNKIIHLGNMLSNKCLLKLHCDDPEWASMKLGALLSNGQPLWPDAWPIEKLQSDFKRYVRMGLADLWFAEMMNQPMAAGSGLIQAKEIPYAPAVYDRNDIEYGFITIDLAISEQTWADECVVAVHGWTGEYWTICEYVANRGVDPLRLWWVVLALVDKWGTPCIGIESVAYQAALKFFFDHLKTENCRPDIQCFDVPARAAKTQRLVGWASGWLKQALYRIAVGQLQLIEQLLLYNPTKKDNNDDVIDACAHGPYMIENFIYQIMDSRNAVTSKGQYIPLNRISTV